MFRVVVYFTSGDPLTGEGSREQMRALLAWAKAQPDFVLAGMWEKP